MEVTFIQDQIFPGNIFSATVGGRQIDFECDSTLNNICRTEGNPPDEKLFIDGDFRSKIYACCKSTPRECYIGIGNVHTQC